MICVDPGKDCGWAEFRGEKLHACGLWRGRDLEMGDYPCDYVEGPIVIEDQVIYPRSKANPNDIIETAKKAGRCAQILGWSSVIWVEPRTWKGTLDGDLMHVRIIKALTPDERFVYFVTTDKMAEGIRHNVADAIGLGLWKLGRLTPQALTHAKARGKKTNGGK